MKLEDIQIGAIYYLDDGDECEGLVRAIDIHENPIGDKSIRCQFIYDVESLNFDVANLTDGDYTWGDFLASELHALKNNEDLSDRLKLLLLIEMLEEKLATLKWKLFETVD